MELDQVQTEKLFRAEFARKFGDPCLTATQWPHKIRFEWRKREHRPILNSLQKNQNKK